MAPKDAGKKKQPKRKLDAAGILASVKHFLVSPLCLAIGALMAVFLIFLTIGMGLLYNMEHQKYENNRAVVELLRDFIIGNNTELEQASEEVIFSLVANKTAVLQELKKAIRQVKIESKRMRELTSGTIGHGYSFYQVLFYIPKKTANFEQAIKECAMINATLVSIKTKEEQRFINDVVLRQLANEHWIGLFRSIATNYSWAWLDEDVKYAIEYWNTAYNVPRHRLYVEGGHNCVANLKQCEDFEIGMWNRCWEDKKCSEIYHFICRITKNDRWL